MKTTSKWYRESVAQHEFELGGEQPFPLKGDSENTQLIGVLRKGVMADARYLDWLSTQGRAPRGKLL